MGVVARGEIWLTVLDPTVGVEIRKTRPCLIVSPDLLNRRGRNSLIVPLTTGGQTTSFRPSTTFAGKLAMVLPDQLRAVDRSRCIRRLGRIDEPTLQATLTILRQLFEP